MEQMELAVQIELADARVPYTVEESRLHHGVVDHVLEDNLVADLEWFVEREVPELVAGKAGTTC